MRQLCGLDVDAAGNVRSDSEREPREEIKPVTVCEVECINMDACY